MEARVPQGGRDLGTLPTVWTQLVNARPGVNAPNGRIPMDCCCGKKGSAGPSVECGNRVVVISAAMLRKSACAFIKQNINKGIFDSDMDTESCQWDLWLVKEEIGIYRHYLFKCLLIPSDPHTNKRFLDRYGLDLKSLCTELKIPLTSDDELSESLSKLHMNISSRVYNDYPDCRKVHLHICFPFSFGAPVSRQIAPFMQIFNDYGSDDEDRDEENSSETVDPGSASSAAVSEKDGSGHSDDDCSDPYFKQLVEQRLIELGRLGRLSVASAGAGGASA